MQMNGERLYLSLNTNPVELAGLFTALAGTFFVILFAFSTDKLSERLPSLGIARRLDVQDSVSRLCRTRDALDHRCDLGERKLG